MFNQNDYRIMMCAKVKDSDLEILLHEMGHIQYFMAYQKLPTIFQVQENFTMHDWFAVRTSKNRTSKGPSAERLSAGRTVRREGLSAEGTVRR